MYPPTLQYSMPVDLVIKHETKSQRLGKPAVTVQSTPGPPAVKVGRGAAQHGVRGENDRNILVAM